MLVAKSANYSYTSRVAGARCPTLYFKSYYSQDESNSVKQKRDEKLIKDTFKVLKDSYKHPRYPLVLCHGFSGFDKLDIIPRLGLFDQKITDKNSIAKAATKSVLSLDYWRGIEYSLEKIGSKVLVAKVPPFAEIHSRASVLHKFLENKCQDLRVHNAESGCSKDNRVKLNLVAHSMGGLDCRYLIHKFKPSNYRVVSLTTVSTPHHGSEFADFITRNVIRSNLLKENFPSIPELTTSAMKKFNEEVSDEPDVLYFSFGARFVPHAYSLFKPTREIMKKEIIKKAQQNGCEPKIDNDGLVSVESAKWGTYLGTLDQVDHLDLINWTNKLRTIIDKVIYRSENNFNAIALYLGIAENLYDNDL
ncbi:Piso0_005642 [Millerozyma farinosa CBS 7064]|uniref:Piso0_005642 protein n=1 Tax=Pichia sorbitophila (strain ATCC MYA-4447 / BCRC 22081 / CBS 7064 / NBRC 10061 / NRRL Y-12695) TaxID=559304 RepID=G8Y2I7_PICSO|nr:Piso0_005642 [Millerozyma farinosa CBS 7064]